MPYAIPRPRPRSILSQHDQYKVQDSIGFGLTLILVCNTNQLFAIHVQKLKFKTINVNKINIQSIHDINTLKNSLKIGKYTLK